jgi:BASS family bile acid:Na+ symporter
MLGPLETALLALLLIVLMFGMGATLTPERFREVAREPKAVLIGLASQFGWMPLLAFLLAKGLELPAPAALGLVIMGTCPGGTTSNMFAYYARADVALSVSMTAASKLVAVVMMPICLWLFARPFSSAEVTIPYGEVIKTLVVLLLPVGLGMWLRRRRGEAFAQRAERVGGLAGLCVLVLLVGASLLRNASLFATITPAMYAASILLGVGGMVLGDLAARVFRLPIRQRRAVSLETGIQNSPLAFAIIATSFDGALEVEMLRLPLLYALFVLIEASLVTLVYRSRAPNTSAVADANLDGEVPHRSEASTRKVA